MVIAGASDAGFVEPGQNTAITLVQITALLFRDRISNLDIMIRTQLLILIRDEIPGALVKASRSLDRDYVRMQVKNNTREQGRLLSGWPIAGSSLGTHRKDLQPVVALQGRPVFSRKQYARLTYQSPRTAIQRCRLLGPSGRRPLRRERMSTTSAFIY